MASIWQRIKNSFFLPPPVRIEPDRPEVTSDPDAIFCDAAVGYDGLSGFPISFADWGLVDANRPQFFDPALTKYIHAFRLGDPEFDDAKSAQRWRTARNEVMHHVLRIAIESPRTPHLVLRGSLLLTTWLGAEARQPGDLDFVFQPATASMNSQATKSLLDGLVAAISERTRVGEALIDANRIVMDDIWTYERAPGRRIVIPWTVEGLPSGEVQIDIVFGDELAELPIAVSIPRLDGGSMRVIAATPALSLAWKLLWLESDCHPQGKDLYDATLLAERTPLPLSLLNVVLQAGGVQVDRLQADFPMRWDVDWPNFQLECPWVTGQVNEWQKRLTDALAPTFMSPDNG